MRLEVLPVGQHVTYSPHVRQGGFDFRIVPAEVVQIDRRVKIAFENREARVTPERLSKPGARSPVAE